MELEPVITELKGKGLSLARIAVELNKRKVATPRGGKWDHSSVGMCCNSPINARFVPRQQLHSMQRVNCSP
jgi:hypothetical protein